MKKIILIRGPICSGKSTIADLLFHRIPDASMVDEDVFKRIIDRTGAPRWRSRLAFDTALFMAEELMKKRRTIIADIHSSKKGRYEQYKELSDKYGYTLHSFLIYPPLDVCLKRNKLRKIPGVSYKISDADIKKYWERLFKVEREKVFGDAKIKPIEIANAILSTVQH